MVASFEISPGEPRHDGPIVLRQDVARERCFLFAFHGPRAGNEARRRVPVAPLGPSMQVSGRRLYPMLYSTRQAMGRRATAGRAGRAPARRSQRRRAATLLAALAVLPTAAGSADAGAQARRRRSAARRPGAVAVGAAAARNMTTGTFEFAARGRRPGGGSASGRLLLVRRRTGTLVPRPPRHRGRRRPAGRHGHRHRCRR